jgi:hypothetical protein
MLLFNASDGGRKKSRDRPCTSTETSWTSHVSSIRVFVWLIASSPNRKIVTAVWPECATFTPSTLR